MAAPLAILIIGAVLTVVFWQLAAERREPVLYALAAISSVGHSYFLIPLAFAEFGDEWSWLASEINAYLASLKRLRSIDEDQDVGPADQGPYLSGATNRRKRTA